VETKLTFSLQTRIEASNVVIEKKINTGGLTTSETRILYTYIGFVTSDIRFPVAGLHYMHYLSRDSDLTC